MNYRFLTSLFLTISSLPLASCNSSAFADITVVTAPTQSIPSTFMGLSHEWGVAQIMMGSSATGVDTIYQQLLRNLTSYGSGPISLRIGGGSTEQTGKPTATTAVPFAEVASALGAHFILGVNFSANDVTLATNQAKAFVNQIPSSSLDAIEIGNEPDMASGYSFEQYMTSFDQWKESIIPILPSGVRLMGPSWALEKSLSNATPFIESEAASLSFFSQHHYAAGHTTSISDSFLLSPGAAKNGALAVASAVKSSHAHGVPFRMAEINSISGGGKSGISDTFQSALWAIDTMFDYASVGADGVNWHCGYENGPYDAFIIQPATANGKTTFTLETVRPLYYGLLFFQAATSNGSQLLPLDMHKDDNVSAWATVDSSGTVRLTLLNKNVGRAGTAHIKLSGSSTAQIYRLTAPSYLSTTGITFAGQTFDGSTDGTIQGIQTTETVQVQQGMFNISMPASSAALVVFGK